MQCVIGFDLSETEFEEVVVRVVSAAANAYIQRVATVVVDLMLRMPHLLEPWMQQAKQEAISHLAQVRVERESALGGREEQQEEEEKEEKMTLIVTLMMPMMLIRWAHTWDREREMAVRCGWRSASVYHPSE